MLYDELEDVKVFVFLIIYSLNPFRTMLLLKSCIFLARNFRELLFLMRH